MKRKLISVLLIVLALAALSSLALRPAAFFPPEELLSAAAAPVEPESTSVQDRARERLSQMTLQEKVWQMLFVFPQDIMDGCTCTDLEAWADAFLSYPAGGIVISGTNMSDEEQLRAMLSCIAGASDLTPFTGIDEEGGKVARLSYTLGVTTDFKPMYTYREGGTETAYQNARTIAEELSDFGFNVDFAPVADVWTNSKNTVIGERAYSSDAQEAAQLVASAVRGFTDGGVVSTLKHFPGHGDTAQDSHFSAATSDKSLEELEKCELLPFSAGIDAGAGMVMAGHITLTQIDSEHPATLSKDIITGILRNNLGYNGVVITDSFAMAAIAGNFDECEAAVMSIDAGCDIILGASDPKAVAQALAENVDEARIDESVLRILELKIQSGIIDF